MAAKKAGAKKAAKPAKKTGAKKTAKPAKKKAGAAKRGGSKSAGSSRDAKNNKGMAILAYIIFFIPLLAGAHKKSRFVKYHANQGLVLFLFYLVYCIVIGIVTSIIVSAVIYSTAYWGTLGAILGLLWLLYLIPLIWCIIGIVNAAQGKCKPLPIIGGITILS